MVAKPPSHPPIRTVTVYCGSSNHIDPLFEPCAFELGRQLARHHLRLVYGGGNTGLMKPLADGCLAEKGQATGIITDHLDDLEIERYDLHDLRVVPTMAERKKIMYQEADGFVALPGGYGTLEEFFEILTWKQIALHAKPIVILNAFHYWDPLLDLLSHIVHHHFARPKSPNLYTVAHHVEDVIRALYLPQHLEDPTSKWGT